MHVQYLGVEICQAIGLGCYLAQTRAFSFLSKQQLLDFQYCFSFSEASCRASLVSFSELLFGEISLWTKIGVGSIRGTILCNRIIKVISFSVQSQL